MNECDSLVEILNEEILCTLGTLSDNGTPHLCTVYFANYRDDRLVFLSEPETAHAHFLAQRPASAVAIASSAQPFASPHKGVSLWGAAYIVNDEGARQDAFNHYASRFPRVLLWLDGRSLKDFKFSIFEFVPAAGTVVDARFDGSENRTITFKGVSHE